ncbi:peptidase [Neisseria sp. HMSC070A01]|uniref:peptidase n=1 Tax=Neisseria sp. HMSC070A01 TaxID=1715190 RepID=UPI0008A3BB74|nr:peptidase [Neisseria sp. HMSC070A01]OFM22991.1 peptidase [Neisseria sp. HMSC070A01]
MNAKKLVKATNIVGMVAVVLLVYWVFVLILSNVFGLKVFREYITEIFLMSILGIFAVMAGALILNIMLNLTRIAERGQEEESKGGRKTLYLLLAVFPVLAALLFGGNYLTVQKKRQILTQSLERIVKDNPSQIEALADYRFDSAYIKKAALILELMSKEDSAFKAATVIVPDTIGNKQVYLAFSADSQLSGIDEQAPDTQGVGDDNGFVVTRNGNKETISKTQYLYAPNLSEREYLQRIFAGQKNEIRYEAKDGNYSLCHPYRQNGKTIVLCFSDYQQYGKIGS